MNNLRVRRRNRARMHIDSVLAAILLVLLVFGNAIVEERFSDKVETQR